MTINGRLLTEAHRDALRLALRYFTTELATVFFDTLSEQGKDFIVKVSQVLEAVGDIRRC